jgi:hypothetical protein
MMTNISGKPRTRKKKMIHMMIMTVAGMDINIKVMVMVCMDLAGMVLAVMEV